MRKSLRWLGHVARMEEMRIPKCLLVSKLARDKCSVSGQKRRWNDELVRDLKKCEVYSNWREQAQDRSTWRGWINAAAEDANEELEAKEQSKKDELKQRRQTSCHEQIQSGWRCREHGCQFVGRSKTGLVNHIRQKHSRVAQIQRRCSHCGKLFQKQSFTMHEKFCKVNPATRS